jgi:hypothetical protein
MSERAHVRLSYRQEGPLFALAAFAKHSLAFIMALRMRRGALTEEEDASALKLGPGTSYASYYSDRRRLTIYLRVQ